VSGAKGIPTWRKPLDALVGSKIGAAIFSRLSPVLDRPLMRLSRGRVAMTFGMPTLLLTTIGRKSGKRRSTPLLYIKHEDDLVVIGTRFGNPSHPAWYLNLKANPAGEVTLGGQQFPVTMREAREDERPLLWDKATQMYGGFERYAKRVGDRKIPVLVLSRSI